MIRDRILAELWRSADACISGEELASRLGVSRTAVWKTIRQLRGEGYQIESAPKRGYRLLSVSDVLSEEGIARHLRHKELTVRLYKTIGSTNSTLKAMAADGAPAGLALVAEEQTAGRGRLGRSFYSPAGSGLYLSLLLRPKLAASEAIRLTACAAVAAAESIEAVSGQRAQIKWVNDIVIDERKVCGILTEASVDCENGSVQFVVIGLGFNVRTPPEGFPPELAGVAGAIFYESGAVDLRCRLAAEVLDRLFDYTAFPDDAHVFAAYRERSFLLGKDIHILRPGQEPVPAKVLDLNWDYSLLVELPDGSRMNLNSGEVSVRPAMKKGSDNTPQYFM